MRVYGPFCVLEVGVDAQCEHVGGWGGVHGKPENQAQSKRAQHRQNHCGYHHIDHQTLRHDLAAGSPGRLLQQAYSNARLLQGCRVYGFRV